MYARQPKTTTFLMKNCLTVFEIKLQAINITVCIEVTMTLCSFDDHFNFSLLILPRHAFIVMEKG